MNRHSAVPRWDLMTAALRKTTGACKLLAQFPRYLAGSRSPWRGWLALAALAGVIGAGALLAGGGPVQADQQPTEAQILEALRVKGLTRCPPVRCASAMRAQLELSFRLTTRPPFLARKRSQISPPTVVSCEGCREQKSCW
jgi:hypothetical protein